MKGYGNWEYVIDVLTHDGFDKIASLTVQRGPEVSGYVRDVKSCGNRVLIFERFAALFRKSFCNPV